MLRNISLEYSSPRYLKFVTSFFSQNHFFSGVFLDRSSSLQNLFSSPPPIFQILNFLPLTHTHTQTHALQCSLLYISFTVFCAGFVRYTTRSVFLRWRKNFVYFGYYYIPVPRIECFTQ